jgi:integrase
MALTEKKVAALKQEGRYHDEHGLYLQIVGRSKTWLLRYQRSGRERWMGLGPTHAFSLKEARNRARQARQQIHDGIDPLAARRAAKAAAAAAAARTITFEQAARQYFDAHEAQWSNRKHRESFLATLQTYAFPKIGTLAVAEVDLGQVLRVIEPMWRNKTVTADRLRQRIEAVLDWATVRGYRQGDNPARWKGHLSEVLPGARTVAKVQHHAALSWQELPAFMSALRGQPGVGARLLEFTILTGARAGEARAARWEEIDLATATWSVPAERMKGRRPHRVPLAPAAVALLKSLPREADNPHVFIGGRPRSCRDETTLRRALRAAGRGDLTVHGFRSTFRDWAAECTAFPEVVIEMALAHTVGNAVERAYRRGDLFDKRRKLMEAWAKYCGQAPAAARPGKVVALRSR